MTLSAAAGGGDTVYPQVGEYRLKAGLLYNLTRFVAWPSESHQRPDAPYSICVADDARFLALLEETIGHRKANGRSLRVVGLPGDERIRDCHLLFLGESRRWRLDALRERAKGASLLTVGESRAFLEQGGVVGLVMDGERVRLEVNVAAATRAGLRINSQLLAIANLIQERPQVATR